MTLITLIGNCKMISVTQTLSLPPKQTESLKKVDDNQKRKEGEKE